MYHVIRTYKDGRFHTWTGSYFTSLPNAEAERYSTAAGAQEAAKTIMASRPWITNCQVETRFEEADDVPSYSNSGGG